jgi:putative transposase
MGSFTQLNYHFVFATKYRHPAINEPIRERLYEYMGGILRNLDGRLLEVGGMPDHIHLLIKLSPSHAVSDTLRDLKANSSKWVHDTFTSTRTFEWQKGYGGFTVSHSQLARVTTYIRNQAEHHRKMTFKEEYMKLLRRHGIEFREEYLFEDEHHG